MTSLSQQTPTVSRWNVLRSRLGVLFESRVGTVGFALVSTWLVVSLVSLMWTPHPPTATDFVQNASPSLQHPLGTDHLGRDLLSRLMAGSQVILIKTRLSDDVTIPGGVALLGVLLVVGRLLPKSALPLGVSVLLATGVLSGR